MLVIPYLQIRSKSIIKYCQPVDTGRFNRSFRQEKSAARLKDRITYTGMLCPGAKKRLTKAIELLVMSATPKTFVNPKNNKKVTFNLNFITLTIADTSRVIPGKEAHKTLLEPFLLWMRRKFGCTMYVWKAEHQKRGQLHYHITSDTFIPWKELRTKWNELQEEGGYLDSFYAMYGHYNPNGTDVHSVYKLKDIAGYLKKEIVKCYQNEKTIGGKVWDCSLNLKAAAYYVVDGYGETNNNLWQAVQNKEVKVTKTDHCTIYDFYRQKPETVLCDADKELFNRQRKELLAYERQPKLEPIIREMIYEPPKKVNFKPKLSLFSSS